MPWRQVVRVALAAGEALGKGFARAVQQELKATKQAAATQSSRAGHSNSEAKTNLAANARLGISLDESLQILNVKEPLEEKLVYRAKERIDEELMRREETPQKKENGTN
ncbi:unnamed protein product, partial [Mesorhabditis spiculigera]